MIVYQFERSEEKTSIKKLFHQARRGGDHEIWYSPILGIHFIVEDEIKSSHTAEAVLKFAGLDKAF